MEQYIVESDSELFLFVQNPSIPYFQILLSL